jgi:hypothetical protein
MLFLQVVKEHIVPEELKLLTLCSNPTFVEYAKEVSALRHGRFI